MSASGVLELHYDCSDPAQLNDWILEPERAGTRDRWIPITKPNQRLEIKDAKLVGFGACARQHVLSLCAPQFMRWETSMISGNSVSSDRPASLLMAFCANTEGRYASVFGTQEIERSDIPGGGHLFLASDSFRSAFDRMYPRESRHDRKETITAYSEGELGNECSCRTRFQGQVLIFLHSDYVMEIDNIVLRGQVTENSMEAYRDTWVQEQLRGLGFDE